MTLSLNDNVIAELNEKISNLKELENLQVRDNLLAVLPSGICNLKNLKVLNLKANELTALPKNLSKLTQLQDLNVAYNLKLDFNKEVLTIGQIKSLKKLDVSYNKLQSLKEQQLKDYLPGCEVLNSNLIEKKESPLKSGNNR